MIKVDGLTKKYGSFTAVDDVSFEVSPGVVTGFLGPNGAGKSTTMRVIMGFERATSGTATIDGKPYHELDEPLRVLGSLLDANSLPSGRTAYQHLRTLTIAAGLPKARCYEVLELVGLESVANKRISGFSLGMKQRLGLATALLGDPGTLMFDEPLNGLDVDGILWFRNFIKELASQGKAILMSSHLMSEVAATADHIIVIGKGKIIADSTMEDFMKQAQDGQLQVQTADGARFKELVQSLEGSCTEVKPQSFSVKGISADVLSQSAMQAGVVLTQIYENKPSLEEAYIDLTRHALEYKN